MLLLEFKPQNRGPHPKNKALATAWWHGWAAATANVALSECPYNPSATDGRRISGRIPWANAWRQGHTAYHEVYTDGR